MENTILEKNRAGDLPLAGFYNFFCKEKENMQMYLDKYSAGTITLDELKKYIALTSVMVQYAEDTLAGIETARNRDTRHFMIDFNIINITGILEYYLCQIGTGLMKSLFIKNCSYANLKECHLWASDSMVKYGDKDIYYMDFMFENSEMRTVLNTHSGAVVICQKAYYQEHPYNGCRFFEYFKNREWRI